jgi:hypothetical protein
MHTTVVYISPRTGQTVTITGTRMDGRYPHMYVYVDTDRGPVQVPFRHVVSVSS